jgi:hypothetical protein
MQHGDRQRQLEYGRLAAVRPGTLDTVKDIPGPPLSPEWINGVLHRLWFTLDRLNDQVLDTSREFDQSQDTSGAVESGTLLALQASYFTTERVESIIVTGPSAGAASSTESEGSVATPGINAFITSVAAPATGLYQIEWTAEVQGATATTPNNYKLTLGAIQTLAVAIQPIAVGTYPQQPQLYYLTAGQLVAIQAIAAEATATIAGQITLVPWQGSVPFTLQLGGRNWPLSLPQTGILVISPVAIRLNQDDLRQISSPVAGPWNLELMGHADVPYRRP